MTLTAVAVLTIFAALLNGFAVTGTLRFLWRVDSDGRQPAYATIPGFQTHPAALSGVMRRQSWVDLTTMDTPMLRTAAPARTPVPVMSYGERDFCLDNETEALVRQLLEA